MTGDTAVLADLVRLWGRWYVIRCELDIYHVERRDDGAAFSTPDIGHLSREIAEDYRVRPVIPWDRAAWERHARSAGLNPGALDTALALAGYADAQGIASPGNRVLASLGACSAAAISSRLFRLGLAGLVVRMGKAGAAGNSRYRLVIPASPLTVDVGQALPDSAGFS